jgi:hypothetical protein
MDDDQGQNDNFANGNMINNNNMGYDDEDMLLNADGEDLNQYDAD